jgi:cytochrome c biogenesis protein CcdA/thiol-disulfide isomerase/thioredoxin
LTALTQRHYPWRSVLAGLLLAVVLFTTLVTAQAPVVQMYLFHSPDCPDCQEVVKNLLPALQEKFGASLEVRLMDINDAGTYQLLQALESTYGISADKATIPEAFLGDTALLGKEELQAKLADTVQRLLDAGGAKFPTPAPTPTPATPAARPTLRMIPTVTPHPAGSVPGAVHIMLFFSPTCPHCEHIRADFMPKIYEKYGEKVVVREFDVTNPYNFALELAIEEKAGMPENQRGYIPLMIVGRYLLPDANVIESSLEQLIDEYLAQGGAPWPIDPMYFEPPQGTITPPAAGTAQPTGTPQPASASSKTIHMAYFAKAGCQECDRAQYEINYLKNKYPNLEVSLFDINEYAALNEWLCTKYNVPERFRLTAPAIFVGQDYLVGGDVSTAKIEALIQKYQASGAEVTWENWEQEAPNAQSRIIERFKSFGVLTVAVAGLIDGLNPCAFATLVFFISYLAFVGRKGRDILMVGASFAIGVFLTYLLVGVGLYQVLTRLPFLTTLGKWVYGITAVLCLLLAVLSFMDYLQARRGKLEEMRLRLPLQLRRRINQVIREGASAQAIAGVAFVTGFVISLIELACTGQVYLPTILFVMGVPAMRAKAFMYLLLYNLLFITPLIVVFVLAYLGTTSEQLARFVNTNTARIKLATALLFIALGAWLITLLI